MQIAMKGSKSGFTLIELLVVITIIGILASLAVPATNKVLKDAKKAQAGTMINNVKVALIAYKADYGAWPEFMASGGSDSEEFSSYDNQGTTLYRMLIGDLDDGDAAQANPRGTVYMEFSKKDLSAGGGTPYNGSNMKDASGFMDPWRSPYWVKVDGNYDNQIDNVPSKAAGTETINAEVAIWSVGAQTSAPQTGSSTNGDRKEFIISW